MDTGNILQKKCMIAKFSTGKYNIFKKDKKGAKIVSDEMGSEEGLGKFTKQAIPKEYIDAIQKNMSAFRTFLYKHSSPWSHKGEVLFPCVFYKKIMDAQREHSIINEDLVTEFLNNYETYKTDARARLNGLYNPADYPNIEKLTRKFKWALDFEPVPDSGNFQIDLADIDYQDIVKNLVLSNDTAVKKAMADVWQRVFDAIKSLSDKMKEKRKDKKGADMSPVFRDSIIENIKDLVDILPGLNVTDDQALESARQDLINDLADIEPGDLRESEDMRKDTAKKADAILNKIENLF